MTWAALTVEWTDRARRDLRRESKVLQARVVQAVERYAETGHGDVKRLRGVESQWRMRVGDWRVLFTLAVDEHGMLVLRVLARGGAYK